MNSTALLPVIVGAVAGVSVAIAQAVAARRRAREATAEPGPGVGRAGVGRTSPVEPFRVVTLRVLRPFREQMGEARALFAEPTAQPRLTRRTVPMVTVQRHVLTFRGPEGTFLTLPTRAVRSVEVGRFPVRPRSFLSRRTMGLQLTLRRGEQEMRLTLFPLTAAGRSLSRAEAEEFGEYVRRRGADPEDAASE